ncbi:predicted protein [Sclerotinia sclerotiorum 1980 UF-70]|uniref:Uncharacterized protein n=1 Tax=Sclerotinia sclerotiorum (strain ATCC 18683 / 1980 / Ss-1) TaxID=665079 RepID=A7F2B8_SCLS1|nr:predicted protein [Sclerotinia sclerotiorum 1980 UF-70]EDN95860.1 predicted protein [Sclerotinia sclerotiorum 1980 UF-70]
MAILSDLLLIAACTASPYPPREIFTWYCPLFNSASTRSI